MNIHLQHATLHFVEDFVADEIATLDRVIAFQPPVDPFRIDHDCLHPQGHDAVAIGRSFVCLHCSKVFGL